MDRCPQANLLQDFVILFSVCVFVCVRVRACVCLPFLKFPSSSPVHGMGDANCSLGPALMCLYISLGRKSINNINDHSVNTAYQDNLFDIISINAHIINFRSTILLLSASLDIMIIWELC